MKKMMTLVMMMTIAISATAMNYKAARDEALFLSDKMAYELGLTATQYEAVYEISLDYLLNVNDRSDVFGFWWEVRNRDLRLVLSTWQYDRFMASEWFYRPIIWGSHGLTFTIYTRYEVGRMFNHRPDVFVTFKGGHSHKGSSFYAGHKFDKPNPPKGHGNDNHKGNLSNNGNHNWKPNGNGNHNPTVNNGNQNHNGNHNGKPNGNGNHNPTVNNGNHNQNGNLTGKPNGNGNHNPTVNNGNRPTTGNGNNRSVGGTFGNNNNNNRSESTTTPRRTFGNNPSGNVASNGNNAPKGNIGGGRR